MIKQIDLEHCVRVRGNSLLGVKGLKTNIPYYDALCISNNLQLESVLRSIGITEEDVLNELLFILDTPCAVMSINTQERISSDPVLKQVIDELVSHAVVRLFSQECMESVLFLCNTSFKEEAALEKGFELLGRYSDVVLYFYTKQNELRF